MFKVDKIKKILDCDICNNILIEPISLSCGYTVCKAHFDKLILQTAVKNITCPVCHDDHTVPDKGFVVNKGIQNLLDMELNFLETSTAYKQCNDELVRANVHMNKLGLSETNAEFYIDEYFQNLKRQVDLRRENLKLEIDDISDSIIKSIETRQANLIESRKVCKPFTPNIQKLKEELDELTQRFKLVFNDNEFQDVKEKLTILGDELNRTNDNYNISLLGNREYIFQFEDISLACMFGHLSNFEIKNKLYSKIIDSTSLQNELYRTCAFDSGQEWKLVYRASVDSFSSNEFHSRCDGIGNTLTVIKAENENIFGGFTEAKWSSKAEYTTNHNGFIYSLINKDKKPFKVMNSLNGAHSIYSKSDCGPTFGGGHDFYIASDSNSNLKSYSNLGHTFKHQDYPNNTEKAKSILAGSYNFKTIEIEVFTKII